MPCSRGLVATSGARSFHLGHNIFRNFPPPLFCNDFPVPRNSHLARRAAARPKAARTVHYGVRERGKMRPCLFGLPFSGVQVDPIFLGTFSPFAAARGSEPPSAGVVGTIGARSFQRRGQNSRNPDLLFPLPPSWEIPRPRFPRGFRLTANSCSPAFSCFGLVGQAIFW